MPPMRASKLGQVSFFTGLIGLTGLTGLKVLTGLEGWTGLTVLTGLKGLKGSSQWKAFPMPLMRASKLGQVSF
jgi:hypothetical protein